MADPVTLFILVAAGERADLTRALVGATRDALGSNAVVVLREVAGEPSDPEALTTERSENADAVAELSWTDARHQQAFVRMHIAQDKRWVERSIGFLRLDADAERGRTLGFAIASILPPASPEVAAPVATPEATPVAPPAPSAPIALPAAQPPITPPQPPATVEPAHAPSAVDVHRSAPSFFALDLMALGGVGITDSAQAVAGGSAAAQWFVLPTLSLRLGGGVRAGTLGSQTSTLTIFGTAGVVWHARPSTAVHPIGLSLRADYLLEQTTVTRLSENHPFDAISGADALVESGLLLAADAQVVLGFGIEGVFGPTSVLVQGKPVGVLPALSVVGELGVRLRF
jgi:hypothetical protein